MVIHKPKFGGKPKAFDRPPNKTANKMLGGMPARKKAQDVKATMDVGMGNREFGFIQNTPKKATGAMMGRAPPKSGRKQFKPKAGKKVF